MFRFLKGSCPHYNGEADKRPVWRELVTSNKIKPGIAADDGVAIHYIDEEVFKIVSSRPNAKAYKIFYDKKVKEIELETEYLGS